MAWMNCRFKSAVLKKWVEVNVLIPQKVFKKDSGAVYPYRDEETRYPVLYLFHGNSDDAGGWMRRTSIERYVEQYGVAVIMPDGEKSYYTDLACGAGDFWTYVSEELPLWVNNTFPVSSERKDVYAAGLSMGGYGALKLGFTWPERFNAVAALSASADVRWLRTRPDREAEFTRIFGTEERLVSSGSDLFTLSEKTVKKAVALPRMISFCGDEDKLLNDNLRFRDHLETLKVKDFHFYIRPGRHNWDFWDTYIQDALRFLFNGTLPDSPQVQP